MLERQGKGLTINEIRCSGYWITGINRAVASYIRQCVTCRRQRKPMEEQRMADLPPERLEPSPPFTFCGMDCFGPFLTKQGRKENKRYGLLFTCLSSRAVHIEILEDMSTDAFINGLRCFIAIRGAVRQIKSDQGSNFVGAKNEFREALKEVDADRLAVFLAEKQCDFSMNAPHASHAGGVWERQIRTVRSVLRSTLALSSGRIRQRRCVWQEKVETCSIPCRTVLESMAKGIPCQHCSQAALACSKKKFTSWRCCNRKRRGCAQERVEIG